MFSALRSVRWRVVAKVVAILAFPVMVMTSAVATASAGPATSFVRWQSRSTIQTSMSSMASAPTTADLL